MEKEPAVISQALHIHHHYHTPKKEEVRRPKKKRTSLNTALFTPPKGMQSPRTPRSQDSASAILSQTSVTVPAPITPNNRWSMQSGQMSDFAPSSVPSSPQSMYRHSGLFDRLDRLDIDSSRPTSPSSSVDPLSPQFQPLHHRKRGSEVSTRSFMPASNFQPHIIHEEDDDVEDLAALQPTPSLENDATPSDTSRDTGYLSTDHEQEQHWTASLQPRLRHSAYQESTFIPLNQDLHRSQSEMAALSFVRELGSALQPQLFPWIRSRVLRWSLPGQPCLVRHVTVLHTSKACVQIAVILGPSLRAIRTRVLRLNWVDGYLVAGV